MNKLPKCAKQNDGCHNCCLCFIMQECDSGDTYYCTFDAPTRPRCNSIVMEGESFSDNGKFNEELYDKRWDEWEAWKEGREVHPYTMCTKWKKV